MAELSKQEIQSPELQEVMSEIPGSFLRWGLFLFFAIIIAIILVSYFIKYPVVVSAPVTITTYNSPASLVAKSGGKISELFVDNEELVSENQPVALIENPATYSSIVALSIIIDSFKGESDWQKKVILNDLPSGFLLGDVQSNYSHFRSTWQQFKEYLKQAYIPEKLVILEKQIIKQEEYTTELINQKRLLEEDMKLQMNSYERDSLLKSNLSISTSELEKSKQTLLQKESSLSSLKASIKNNESAILSLKETRLDLQVQFEKDTHQYRLDLDEALQLLQVTSRQWIEKYLIESPIKGRITFTSFWNKNQVIKVGEILATVIPEDGSMIIVRAHVPASGFGRVKVGQQVNIKLSGFPYMEFGVIKGRIKTLSQVPIEGVYIAEVDLIDGMNSSYNKNISFIQEMDGTADIITERTRLISKFINPLKSVLLK